MAKKISKKDIKKAAKKREPRAVKKLSAKAEGIVNARKPKTGKGRRILKGREPKVHEDAKKSLILRGNKSDPAVLGLLRELHDLRKPLDTLYAKKHDIHPFLDAGPVEKLCSKVDASLFAFGSKSKKRPFRLAFGRLFNGGLMDLHEFGVKNYMPEAKFKGVAKPLLGSKPLVIFQGAGFDHHPRLKNARSILLDFFRGPDAERINLMHIDHAIIFTVLDSVSVETPQIAFRHYKIDFKKSMNKNPYSKLTELGPRFDLALDRDKMPDPETMKAAMRLPKDVRPTKVKNVKTDSLGRKMGRVHLGRQEFNEIHTPLFHLKKGKKEKKEKKGDTEKTDSQSKENTKPAPMVDV